MLVQASQNAVRIKKGMKTVKDPRPKYKEAQEVRAQCEEKFKNGEYAFLKDFLVDMTKCYSKEFQDMMKKIDKETTHRPEPEEEENEDLFYCDDQRENSNAQDTCMSCYDLCDPVQELLPCAHTACTSCAIEYIQTNKECDICHVKVIGLQLKQK